VSAVWCQVEISATGRSLVQRSLTECGVSQCNREASIIRPWPTRGLSNHEKNISLFDCYYFILYFVDYLLSTVRVIFFDFFVCNPNISQLHHMCNN
jgi:hypothetical protein